MEGNSNKYTQAAKEAKKKLEEGYNKAEAEADELVTKGEAALASAKKSKWTAAGMTAVVLSFAAAATLFFFR